MRKGRPTADGMSEKGGEVLGRIAARASLGRNVSLARRAGTKKAAVAADNASPHAPAMFVVTEADAAAIRAIFRESGEFAAAIELRRRFPGVTDNRKAREYVRTIAG